MSTQLQRILENTLREVTARRASTNLSAMERRAAERTPRGFEAALRRVGASGPAVIAELKKASPSRGLIRAEFNVLELARALESAGAAALSVLTDERFFQGSLENLELASSTVNIPCLRKDFMADEFQVLEARAAGASAILLIVAALEDAELQRLARRARELELDILWEVHDKEELARALGMGASVVGVNSRNLHTMEVRPETQMELAELLPSGAVLVAESGIRDAGDVARLREAGYTAFLIGETLMRQPDPAAALRELLVREHTATA